MGKVREEIFVLLFKCAIITYIYTFNFGKKLYKYNGIVKEDQAKALIR